MSGVAIVAIPEEDDPVWKISSEKVPHMTLLFLGEISDSVVLGQMWEFIAHATDTTLNSFFLEVNSRGPLGKDNADVVFFDPKYTKGLAEFRSQLLTDTNIFKAHASVEQYPQWTPHLTLGYPATPAKKDDNIGKLWGVSFNKIALWTGEYSGPEFPLQQKDYPEEVVMADTVEDRLAHYGIPGMRWGKRKADSVADGETVATQKKPGTKVTATGGKKVEASPDAIKAATSKQKAKVSTTDSLSTKELQELVTRMNLEQQYERLVNPPKNSKNALTLESGTKKVKTIMEAKKTMDMLYSDPMVNQVAKPFVEKYKNVALKTALSIIRSR